MKFITKIFFLLAILINPLNIKVTAQIEDHYHSFSGKIYIPFIVNRQEVMKFNDGRINEKNIPDKVTSVSFYMKAEDMRVNNNVFSGIIINNTGSTMDEFITYKGKVSKDKQKLEYIEITKETTVYILSTRENIEKTSYFSVRFENIPKSYGGFEYEYGITNITSVSYNEEYAIPRYGYIDSYTETFVKINEKAISKYYTGVSANFKPGELKLKLKDDIKISVIPEEKEMLAVAVHALMVNELLKIPDLKVLEGFKIDKLIDEINLSQTGLVSKETMIRNDRMMTPDVEIHILAEHRVPEDFNSRIEKVTLRSKIKIVKSGKVYDPSLTFNFDLEQIKKEKNFFERIDAYIEKVITYASHYLYE